MGFVLRRGRVRRRWWCRSLPCSLLRCRSVGLSDPRVGDWRKQHRNAKHKHTHPADDRQACTSTLETNNRHPTHLARPGPRPRQGCGRTGSTGLRGGRRQPITNSSAGLGRGRNRRTSRTEGARRHVLFSDYLLFARVIMKRELASKVHDDATPESQQLI